MRGEKPGEIQIGDVYAGWEVISEEPTKHYNRRWKIRCSHGKEEIKTSKSIKSYLKECACNKYQIGEKANFLTIIEGRRYKNNNMQIKVKCDCGTEKFMNANAFGKVLACYYGCSMTIVNKFEIGQIIGDWKILELSKTIDRRRKSLCQCVCGTQKYIRDEVLKSVLEGKSNYGRSCGCTVSVSEFDVFFTRVETNARTRKYDLNITAKDIENLYIKQNKKCALSGVEIDFGKRIKKSKYYCSASLDRIDSSKGYELDNIQLVHKDVNLMKQSYTQEKFIEWSCLIADHQRKLKEKGY